MPTIAELSNDVANIKFRYQGLDFNVKYAPSKYTAAVEDKWQESMRDERRDLAIISMCDAILLEWDLTEDDEDKTPIPPHLPHLKKIPIKFLNSLLRAIVDEANPNP